MLHVRQSPITINLASHRLTVRTVNYHDSHRLAAYYSENQAYLQPWEPKRDATYCLAEGWQMRLKAIEAMQQQGTLRAFILLNANDGELLGIINFSHIIKGDFCACYLGYSLAQKAQGQGLMHEGLQLALGYMFQQQQMHRIMANYMPNNLRSGNVLKRLGFEREGYAKDYLRINGQWQDHILTSLLSHQWQKSDKPASQLVTSKDKKAHR